jgi:hypothetical protein
LSRSVEPKLAQERERRTTEKAAEMLLQRAQRDPTFGGQVAKPPRALGLGLEPLERLF